MRRPDQAGAADVGLDVDGREAAAVAHQVVEVVDVVRVPVVLGGGAQELVRDADLLELFLHPAELLVDVAGGDQRAVGVVELVPVHDRRNFPHRLGSFLIDHGVRKHGFHRSCFPGYACVQLFIRLRIIGPAVMASSLSSPSPGRMRLDTNCSAATPLTVCERCSPAHRRLRLRYGSLLVYGERSRSADYRLPSRDSMPPDSTRALNPFCRRMRVA